MRQQQRALQDLKSQPGTCKALLQKPLVSSFARFERSLNQLAEQLQDRACKRTLQNILELCFVCFV